MEEKERIEILKKENEKLKREIDMLKKVVLHLIDFATEEVNNASTEFWEKYGEEIQRGSR